MKLERDKVNQRFIKLKHQEDIKTSKDISLLLEITKNNSAKLDKLDDDLNSNPFTILFKARGKQFLKYLLVLIITIAVMIGVYLLWVRWIYDWRFTKEGVVEILGNGFFWILASVAYFTINFLVKGGILKWLKKIINK